MGLMLRDAFDPAYGQELAHRAGGAGRVRVWTSDYFGREAFQLYLNAADAVVAAVDQAG